MGKLECPAKERRRDPVDDDLRLEYAPQTIQILVGVGADGRLERLLEYGGCLGV